MAAPKPAGAAPKGRGAATLESKRKADAFVAAYGRTGNATQAAIEAGYSPRSARPTGSKLLTDPDIYSRAQNARQAYLDGQQDVRARQSGALIAAADDAITYLHSLLKGDVDSRGSPGKVAAALGVLDRAGHKPVEKVEQKVELTTDAAAARERLKAKLAGG